MVQPSFQFSSRQRIKTGDDFRRCYNSQRAGDGHLLAFAVLNGTEQNRLGLSVSKKHGNAVARNRKKRLLREAFRLIQHDLPTGMDVVVVPRLRTDSTLTDYQQSLKRVIRKLHRRMKADVS